jgi:DNA-binding CsgD family transcriptional regulator
MSSLCNLQCNAAAWGWAVHVSLSALENALRFAEDLADTDDPADLGRRALPGLGRLVHADLLSYNELDPGSGHLSYWTYPENVVFSPEIAAAFEAHVHENPLVSHMEATGDGSPVKISDFLTLQRFHRLAVYTEFYRHVPVEHQIAIGLPPLEGRVVAIALNRARGRDFTEQDRDLLAVLRVPLLRAMFRVRSRHQARQALSRPDGGVAALTERELELLELVATGHTNAAIARMLQISPRTVANHLDHIYRKLDVSSRAAAVYRAVAEGLVTPQGTRSS